MKAVVLAGGLGTRLRPYTLLVPKPMLPLGEKPVLEHLVEWLKNNGVHEIGLCVGYLRRIIEDYFRDGRDYGVRITYIRTSRPMGTAGQLRTAKEYVDGSFLCVYGDSVFNFNLKRLIRFHRGKKALATMALMPYKVSLKYGFVELNSDGAVKAWREKPQIEGLINIGCYVMEPRFSDYIPQSEMYGMDKAFQRAVDAGEAVYGLRVEGDFVDIGDRRTYAAAYEKYLKRLGQIL